MDRTGATPGANQVTGSLAAARNFRIKVDMGSVVVRGGQQQGINYVVHSHAYESRARRRAARPDRSRSALTVKGDTAWIMGEWEGGRPRQFSGEFVINIPRDTDAGQDRDRRGQSGSNRHRRACGH